LNVTLRKIKLTARALMSRALGKVNAVSALLITVLKMLYPDVFSLPRLRKLTIVQLAIL
jgi:hypothetical protein